MKSVMFLMTNMNIGGTEKALLNMLEVIPQDEYNIDLYLLEEKGGLLEDIPDWVNLYIIDEYSKYKSWILDPPLRVCRKLLKQFHFINAMMLFITHVIFKFTGDRTSYYKVVLNKFNNVDKNYNIAVSYSGPFDFGTSFILEKVNANKKIQWIHFDVSKFFFNLDYSKKNYPMFDEIIVVSEEAKQSLVNKIPTITNKTRVVHNFLPTANILKKGKEFMPYADEKFKILTVGRLTSEKGQIIIPQIVKLLIDEGINDFCWYIVGEGNMFDDINNLINKLQLSSYIKMCGLVKNPYPYYKNCDLYVQTSIHEGFCITIGEALIFNKYVISTDVAGAREQLNEKNGTIVNYDAEELKNAIIQYIK